MSIADLLSVLSFGLACFSIGYAFGKDKSTKKYPPGLSNCAVIF